MMTGIFFFFFFVQEFIFNPFLPFFLVVINKQFYFRLFISAAKQVQTSGDVLGGAKDEVDENRVEGGVKAKDGWD